MMRSVITFWLVVACGIFSLFAWSAHSSSYARFHTGETVRSKIARFRGTVTDRYCTSRCVYVVRFNGATMEPQWMEEYELEPQ